MYILKGCMEKGRRESDENTWEPEWNLSEELLGEVKKMRRDNEFSRQFLNLYR